MSRPARPKPKAEPEPPAAWNFLLVDVPPPIQAAIRDLAQSEDRPLRWAALRLLALGVAVRDERGQ